MPLVLYDGDGVSEVCEQYLEGMKVANSKHIQAIVCLAYLIVLSGAFGLIGGQSFAGSAGGNAGAIVRIVPADSVVVLEVDNFEYTLSTVDQFLQGISPIPLGLQMLVRAQFAQVLGNPTIAGVDMNGTFGAFVLAPPKGAGPGELTQADPDSVGFAGVLVPVTDYSQFITANPNCGAPDAQGISKLKLGATELLVKQAGNFAFVTQYLFYDKAVAIANGVAASAVGQGQGRTDVFVSQVAGKPVRLFVDIGKAVGELGPMAEQMKQAQGVAPGGQALPPAVMNMDFSEIGKSLELEFVTLGLSPSADVLNASVDIVSLPNSKLAAVFAPDSQELAEGLAMLKAKRPNEMGAALATVQALLPDAGNADFAGTFNLVEMMQMAAMMSPMELPAIDMKATSGGGYAINVDNGALTFDLALPKQHLSEIITASMTMTDVMPGMAELPQAQELPEPVEMATPSAPIDPVTVVDPGDRGAVAGGGLKVRVAGARLVRESDIERGILPLGQTNGYTLSLLAELPEPALKISGGTIEKARTDTGKSLLPAHAWQRKIGFVKLSKDRGAALFDVELALPDYDVKSLEELSGQLEYITGSGTKEVDLGVMALKAGARGQRLNAVVSSVEKDPYGNNATILRLKLDLPPESLKSVAFFASGGSPMAVNPTGHITIGSATTFRLAIGNQVPAQARIVLTVYETFNRNAVPFSLGRMSLTGEPTG